MDAQRVMNFGSPDISQGTFTNLEDIVSNEDSGRDETCGQKRKRDAEFSETQLRWQRELNNERAERCAAAKAGRRCRRICRCQWRLCVWCRDYMAPEKILDDSPDSSGGLIEDWCKTDDGTVTREEQDVINVTETLSMYDRSN